MQSWIIYVLLLIGENVCTSSQFTPIVKTAYGQIQGFIDNIEEVPLNAFLGIRYAKAPTGARRFLNPQRPDTWNGVKNATNFGAACPQPTSFFNEPPKNFYMDEDCLYLNVFVSGNMSQHLLSPLPVMVFIHGGGFIEGSAFEHYADYFATKGDPIVTVVIQYRLGLLGLFTMGDVSGNMGLKDQVFALKWVQENIAGFGGDKDRVTIFGESAGGESVLLHMVSPMSRGLFHRAIAQSGPAPWRYPRRNTLDEYYRRKAPVFSCYKETGQLQCIQEIPWPQILYSGAVFNIVIDGEFLIEDPMISYTNGRVNVADFMVGFTNDDGDVFVTISLIKGFSRTVGLSDQNVTNSMLGIALGRTVSDNIPDPSQTQLYRRGKTLENIEPLTYILRGKYTSFDPIQNARGILDALRDSFFITFSMWAATQIANNGGNVYLYSFEHRAAYLGSSAPGEVPLYAPHAHEQIYLFGHASSTSNTSWFTDDEQQMALSMIKAWTSFSYRGQPSFLDMSNTEIEWPKYTVQEKKYVKFDVNMSSTSVWHADYTWQPITDFWLAVQSLAVFQQDDESDPTNKEKFTSDILKLDDWQADIAVIALLCVVALLLVTTLVLCCYASRASKNANYIM